MSAVALAGCTRTEDPDLGLLVDALARDGVDATAVAWDDPDADWDRFDATIIRSTWDYPDAYDAFLAWARRVPRLSNPAEVVAWNADKRYLDALSAAGVPTIETSYATSGGAAVFPDGPFVVKPTVGGGSRGVTRFTPSEADLARAHVDAIVARGVGAMIQPLVASVADAGETDVIVIDGEVSHAVVKYAPIGTSSEPASALFSDVAPTTIDGAQAELVARALAVVPARPPLCYARVDLVATPSGPAVIELELIEPFFFLATTPHGASRASAAIARRASRR